MCRRRKSVLIEKIRTSRVYIIPYFHGILARSVSAPLSTPLNSITTFPFSQPNRSTMFIAPKPYGFLFHSAPHIPENAVVTACLEARRAATSAIKAKRPLTVKSPELRQIQVKMFAAAKPWRQTPGRLQALFLSEQEKERIANELRDQALAALPGTPLCPAPDDFPTDIHGPLTESDADIITRQMASMVNASRASKINPFVIY